MDNENDKIIADQLKSLPEPLQKAIGAVPWKTITREVGSTHNLNLYQIDLLTRETMFIIYGFESPNDYPGNLSRELIVTSEVAYTLAEEIAERVFKVISDKADEFEKNPPIQKTPEPPRPIEPPKPFEMPQPIEKDGLVEIVRPPEPPKPVVETPKPVEPPRPITPPALPVQTHTELPTIKKHDATLPQLITPSMAVPKVENHDYPKNVDPYKEKI
jgi:hypothetical protein